MALFQLVGVVVDGVSWGPLQVELQNIMCSFLISRN